MTKFTNFILGMLVVSVIVIGIGYANLADRELNITGTVNAGATDTDFVVEFVEDATTTWDATHADGEGTYGVGTVTASASGQAGTFNVSGLKVVGDTCSATYTIQNHSKGIYATNVRAAVTGADHNYIDIDVSEPSATVLDPVSGTATVTVTATLTGTPLSAQTHTVGVQILATPSETATTPAP